MDQEMTFSLSYEQLTTITEQCIRQCIQNAIEVSGREADIEMDWAAPVWITGTCWRRPVMRRK